MKKVILATSVLLTGCAAGPKNIDELKRADYKQQFTVNRGYQEVYRNIKNGFAQCGGFESTWLKPSSVQTDLYTDIKEGQFTINLVPGVGQQRPLVHIKINQKTDDTSSLTIYQTSPDNEKSSAIYRRWANGDLSCE